MPFFISAALLLALGADLPWPGWGGPAGNFRIPNTKIASSFAPEGPPTQWKRSLGEGYSSFACDGSHLFTMLRKDDQEIAIALDANTGETVWEFSWEAPIESNMDVEHGPGPHSTPLLCEDVVVCVGVTVKVKALSRSTGDLIWERDLRQELGATHLKRGYCASPIRFKDSLILPLSGDNQSMISLSVETGKTIWNKGTFNWCYSTPAIVHWEDRDEVVVFSDESVEGFHPETGEELWRVPHPTQMHVNVCTPVFEDGILFVSSAYGEGSRGIRLTRESKATKAEELWHERRMQIHHGNAVRAGDFVYGSSGSGSALLTCMNLETGEIAWRERAIGKSTLLEVDGKLLILDENGTLFLVNANPEKLDVASSISLLESPAWTAPILVGTTLYLRDRKNALALDLAARE